MDKNEFFKEATKRICSQLSIEQAMISSLNFLSNFMPAEGMLFTLFDQGLSATRVVAAVTKNEGIQMDFLIPLSKDAQNKNTELVKNFQKGEATYLATLVNDNIYENPLFKEVFMPIAEDVSSLLILPMELNRKVFGGGVLVLTTSGENKFTEKHRDLISTLKEPFSIAMSNALKHKEVLKLKELLIDDNRYLHHEIRKLSGEEIIGSNYGLKEVMLKVQQVSNLDCPVLLLGETGVGKDVIANVIHDMSLRSKGPFISINCGAIPDSLIDSELFGHEKGAFTGAISQKRGRFERAENGTIFLDEIGELLPAVQVRLLRVLQNKEIERVGGTSTIKLNIRIIAATNRNLEEMISNNKFREDLWFRLNVFPILVPPLRERRVDIPAFVQYFIEQISKEMKLGKYPSIVPGALDSLMLYDWPGNVRELQNVIERSIIINPDGPIEFDSLTTKGITKPPRDDLSNNEVINLDEAITKHIMKVLSLTNGKVHGKGGAADKLGINPSTLRNRMNKLGIDYKKGK